MNNSYHSEEPGFGWGTGVPFSWELESGNIVSADIHPYGVRPLRLHIDSAENETLASIELGVELASETVLFHECVGQDWFALFRKSVYELLLIRHPSAETFARIPVPRGESVRGSMHPRGRHGGLIVQVDDSLMALTQEGAVLWALPLWPTDQILEIKDDALPLRRSQHPMLSIDLVTGDLHPAR